jgi:7-carboxy-7-deazaguanine synthase
VKPTEGIGGTRPIARNSSNVTGYGPTRMWISEVFSSVQGEGRYAGVPSGFIRISGCNLRCRFCDTPYTSWKPEGTERSLESLIDEIRRFDCEHVVLTGGEPMLVPELALLSRELRALGYVVTIETAGTVVQEVDADLMSISPKLSNSVPVGTSWEQRHRDRQHRPGVIERLTDRHDYQFKFVIAEPADVAEVETYLEQFPRLLPEKIYLMPEGTDREVIASRMEWLQEAAGERGWQVSPRLHIELFGNTRGT